MPRTGMRGTRSVKVDGPGSGSGRGVKSIMSLLITRSHLVKRSVANHADLLTAPEPDSE